jgi:hypothetical protein
VDAARAWRAQRSQRKRAQDECRLQNSNDLPDLNMYSQPVFRLYATIDPSERRKWHSYLPIVKGPKFTPEKSTRLNARPLKQLAARVIGESLGPGVEEAAGKLRDLLCAPVLIRTVFPYVTLDREEYQRYLHYEWYYPTSSPLSERYRLIRTYYNKVYPTAAEHYVETESYSQEGRQIMTFRPMVQNNC